MSFADEQDIERPVSVKHHMVHFRSAEINVVHFSVKKAPACQGSQGFVAGLCVLLS